MRWGTLPPGHFLRSQLYDTEDRLRPKFALVMRELEIGEPVCVAAEVRDGETDFVVTDGCRRVLCRPQPSMRITQCTECSPSPPSLRVSGEQITTT